MNSRVVAATAAVLFAVAVPALAQSTSTPSPAPTKAPVGMPTIPPGLGGVVQTILQKMAGDATAPYAVDPNHVRGTVTFYRRFDLQVRLPLDQYKQVHLHQGTIINPRGESIGNGQTVDVRGRANSDGSLEADEITIVHG